MRSLCGVLMVGLMVGAVCTQRASAQVTAADYPAKMKLVAQTNGELQKALKAGVAADAVAPAKALSAIFADVEKFWAGQKKDDAVKLAAQARMGFADAAAAAGKGDAMAAQMAAGNALATCKQCHGAYREGNPQEGFKFKAGTVQ